MSVDATPGPPPAKSDIAIQSEGCAACTAQKHIAPPRLERSPTNVGDQGHNTQLPRPIGLAGRVPYCVPKLRRRFRMVSPELETVESRRRTVRGRGCGDSL